MSITGFFSLPKLSRQPDSILPRCGSCGRKNCKSPDMPVTGEGRRQVLVMAEAPGSEEDRQGTQLIGKSGQRLRSEMKKLGWDLDRDCWKTNACRCHGDGDNPTDAQVMACRPNVTRDLKELNPDVVILLGACAIKSVVGRSWRESIGEMGRWVGWRIPDQRLNAWVCPTWHPSYLLRQNDPVLDLWFGRHVEAALGLSGRPWKRVPDYLRDVRLEHDPRRATSLLEEMTKRDPSKPFSFDYETNRLKPDHPEARIVSCAISDGKTALAFPWTGGVIPWMSSFLRSKRLKIAANIKFEDRWTRREFDHGVRNWHWDTMVVAHVLDNRRKITGLKFQAYVQFGQPPWDESVEEFLKAKGSNERNRIHKVELRQLLLYNGMDALLEYKLYEKQKDLMRGII